MRTYSRHCQFLEFGVAQVASIATEPTSISAAARSPPPRNQILVRRPPESFPTLRLLTPQYIVSTQLQLSPTTAAPQANVKRPKFPNLLYDLDQERLNRMAFLQRRRERLGTGIFRGLYENRVK